MAGDRILFDDITQNDRNGCRSVAGGASIAAFACAQAPDIPKHGRAVVLFDGKDLSQFDTFLPSTGLNSDPNQVFTVENRTHPHLRPGDGLHHHQTGVQKLLPARRIQVGRGHLCAARRPRARQRHSLQYSGPEQGLAAFGRVSNQRRLHRRFLDDRRRSTHRQGRRSRNRPGRQLPRRSTASTKASSKT